MELSELKYIKLSPDFEIPPFHCEDDDLNAFLIEDAKDGMDEMMSVTYLFVDPKANKTVAYYTLLNDKVAYDPLNKSIWNRINRHIINRKRRKTYPCMKIGRLAVSEEYAKCGLGSQIMDFIKTSLVFTSIAGCRFLTLDAYAKATEFYKKNNFEYFTMLDAMDSTRQMFFDLKLYRNSLKLNNIEA